MSRIVLNEKGCEFEIKSIDYEGVGPSEADLAVVKMSPYGELPVLTERDLFLYDVSVDNFINSTSHCTTGDAKLIPVLIPDNEILKSCNRLFTSAFELKKSVAKGITTDISIQSELEIIEEENDNLIACLYSI